MTELQRGICRYARHANAARIAHEGNARDLKAAGVRRPIVETYQQAAQGIANALGTCTVAACDRQGLLDTERPVECPARDAILIAQRLASQRIANRAVQSARPSAPQDDLPPAPYCKEGARALFARAHMQDTLREPGLSPRQRLEAMRTNTKLSPVVNAIGACAACVLPQLPGDYRPQFKQPAGRQGCPTSAQIAEFMRGVPDPGQVPPPPTPPQPPFSSRGPI